MMVIVKAKLLASFDARIRAVGRRSLVARKPTRRRTCNHYSLYSPPLASPTCCYYVLLGVLLTGNATAQSNSLGPQALALDSPIRGSSKRPLGLSMEHAISGSGCQPSTYSPYYFLTISEDAPAILDALQYMRVLAQPGRLDADHDPMYIRGRQSC